MPNRDIVVIGGSLGGPRAVRELLSGLEPDIEAAIFVVLHTHPESPRMLARMFAAQCHLPVDYALDRDTVEHGHVYVAPPDYHMVLEAGLLRINRNARENRSRPAIDPLFRSAARWYGSRVIAVLLTGMLDDGVQGLWFVKRRGGITIVQDPDDAEAADMPLAAIAEGVADHVVPLHEMPRLVNRLVRQSVPTSGVDQGETMVRDSASRNVGDLHPASMATPPGPVTCPECNGALWIDEHSKPVRYQCHVGHQFSEHTLEAAKRDELESALWTALRVLKENSAMYGSMIERARRNGSGVDLERFEVARAEMQRRIDVVRDALGEDGRSS